MPHLTYRRLHSWRCSERTGPRRRGAVQHVMVASNRQIRWGPRRSPPSRGAEPGRDFPFSTVRAAPPPRSRRSAPATAPPRDRSRRRQGRQLSTPGATVLPTRFKRPKDRCTCGKDGSNIVFDYDGVRAGWARALSRGGSDSHPRSRTPDRAPVPETVGARIAAYTVRSAARDRHCTASMSVRVRFGLFDRDVVPVRRLLCRISLGT